MKVLLVSASVSSRLQNSLYERYGVSTGFAIQKYYRLLEEGLLLNGAEVEELSIVPIKKADAPFTFKRFKNETEGGVRHRYLSYLKYAVIYHPLVVIALFFKVLFWGLRHRRDSVIICDILIPSVCIGTAYGAALAGCKRIAWVTDMPGIATSGGGSFESMGLMGRMQVKAISGFSGFIFSTRQANAKLNPGGKPYVVIEGFVPSGSMLPKDSATSGEKVIMYAGGLREEYGVGALCEAFMKLKDMDDIRLVLYGNGAFTSKVKEYMAEDHRIEFRGTATNSEIVRAEKEATLLVNPRFTGAEYTLYSYPSKNIEYMVSGTPMVTTRLAGIPEDHFPYIFLFDDESVDGYAATLRTILSKQGEELKDFGRKAAEYIISTRSSEVQVRKILDLASRL